METIHCGISRIIPLKTFFSVVTIRQVLGHVFRVVSPKKFKILKKVIRSIMQTSLTSVLGTSEAKGRGKLEKLIFKTTYLFVTQRTCWFLIPLFP